MKSRIYWKTEKRNPAMMIAIVFAFSTLVFFSSAQENALVETTGSNYAIPKKTSYVLGEIVEITARFSDDSVLQISDGQLAYAFLGTVDKSIKFEPKNEGEYAIRIIDGKGNVIDESGFSVAAQGKEIPQDKNAIVLQPDVKNDGVQEK